MRIDDDDRTSAAIIRDAALQLFAERGITGVTVRQIAAAAGVSPGLVTHHFGSKDGLKAAVDERVAADVERMLARLPGDGGEDGHRTLAEMLATELEREPALAAYIRRLLLDGGDASDSLFGRLFEMSLRAVARLDAAGVMRPARDEHTRAAFLLANDLALILLRPQIERAIGLDPLGREGLRRWTAEVMDVYTHGVFVGGGVPLGADSTTHVRRPHQ